MTNDEIVLGLPGYQITGIEREKGVVRISVRYTGPRSCPHCGGMRLRSKGLYRRRVRHENWGLRRCELEVEAGKWRCLECGRQFRQRLPGVLPCQRSTEAYRLAVFRQHLDGINRSRLGRREALGAATVERYFRLLIKDGGGPDPGLVKQSWEKSFDQRRNRIGPTRLPDYRD